MHLKFFPAAVLALLATHLTGCITTHMAIDRAQGYETFPARDRKTHDSSHPPLKPDSAYYALLAIAVPVDLVTCPIQAPVLVWLLGQRR